MSKNKGASTSGTGASTSGATSSSSTQPAAARPGLAPLSEDNTLLRDVSRLFASSVLVEARVSRLLVEEVKNVRW